MEQQTQGSLQTIPINATQQRNYLRTINSLICGNNSQVPTDLEEAESKNAYSRVYEGIRGRVQAKRMFRSDKDFLEYELRGLDFLEALDECFKVMEFFDEEFKNKPVSLDSDTVGMYCVKICEYLNVRRRQLAECLEKPITEAIKQNIRNITDDLYFFGNLEGRLINGQVFQADIEILDGLIND